MYIHLYIHLHDSKPTCYKSVVFPGYSDFLNTISITITPNQTVCLPRNDLCLEEKQQTLILYSLVSPNFIFSGFTQLYVLWFHSILYYLVSPNFMFSGFTQLYVLWFHSILYYLVSPNFMFSGFTQFYILWFHPILGSLVSPNFIFSGFTQFYVLWLHPILYSLVSPNQRSNP